MKKMFAFGVPVDPEVYITIAVSSGVGDAVIVSPIASIGVVDSMLAPLKTKVQVKISYKHRCCIANIQWCDSNWVVIY